MAFQEGTAKSAGFIVVSNSLDVCKSPEAHLPYNIVGFLNQLILTSTNVNFQSFPVSPGKLVSSGLLGNGALDGG